MILASASPRRAELLRAAGIVFSVFPADVREWTQADGFAAEALPMLNAEKKAAFAAERFPEEWVLGADTLVLLDGVPLGKPASPAEAEAMLSRLSGRTHQVKTGMALLRHSGNFRFLWEEESDVTFKTLTPEQIRSYLRQIDPLDKAGGYAIQEHGDMIVEKWTGEKENIIGLPLKKLTELLRMFPDRTAGKGKK